ncbi:MAG: hypothetical protein KC431_15290, partial [Myxococcales bacterium]|nr:hypothetical protein [Myxococcales bacterium]
MSNDFSGAQSSLDELGALGAENANIAGLQANLDLVQGRGEAVAESSDGQSAVVARRIKDQAKSRAVDDEIALLEKAREAEEYEAKGDYDKAEEKLAEAKEIGDRLALLEQSESQEQVAYNQGLSSSSMRVAEKKKQKVSRESREQKRRWVGSKQAPAKDPSVIERAVVNPKSGYSAFGSTTGPDDDESYVVEGEYDAYAYDGDQGGQYADVGAYYIPEDSPANISPEKPSAQPEQKPVPEEDTRILVFDEDEYAGERIVITGDTMTTKLPVGADTSRDFSVIVEQENPLVEPTSEEVQVIRAMPGIALGGRVTGKTRNARGRRDRLDTRAKTKTADLPPSPPPPPPAVMDPSSGANIEDSKNEADGKRRGLDPNAALAGPVATASAVAVHIPAIGEAVLYQRMLLPEGEALTVHIEARRRRPHQALDRSPPRPESSHEPPTHLFPQPCLASRPLPAHDRGHGRPGQFPGSARARGHRSRRVSRHVREGQDQGQRARAAAADPRAVLGRLPRQGADPGRRAPLRPLRRDPARRGPRHQGLGADPR